MFVIITDDVCNVHVLNILNAFVDVIKTDLLEANIGRLIHDTVHKESALCIDIEECLTDLWALVSGQRTIQSAPRYVDTYNRHSDSTTQGNSSHTSLHQLVCCKYVHLKCSVASASISLLL